ncbi:unnamed protein product, partial [Brenthis ino]
MFNSNKIKATLINKLYLFINKSSVRNVCEETAALTKGTVHPRTEADAPALDYSRIDLMTMNGKPPFRSISLHARYCTAALFLANHPRICKCKNLG